MINTIIYPNDIFRLFLTFCFKMYLTRNFADDTNGPSKNIYSVQCFVDHSWR